ncbi:MAG TPA: hypothetical protein VK772_16365 [Puia sp.]|nr:hypothetical protein [Puia sp.]
MNNLDTQAFIALFRDAYQKCFGYSLTAILSETESKLFYNKIFGQTGLVVGWKSLKNYSSFVLDPVNGKTENPSIATLDSLARFVTGAPYITETQRKEKENHYPYWFEFKERFHRSLKREKNPSKTGSSRSIVVATLFFLIVGILVFLKFSNRESANTFTDDFSYTSMETLYSNGWLIQSPDSIFWKRRGENHEELTLFTLRGDNWPDKKEKLGIQNLLFRKITQNCFEAEVHMADFLPDQDWQQAGILLMEDTSFTGKSIRLSVAYNDFFGGYSKPAEIIVQAITSLGKNYGEPEEIAHQLILSMDSFRLNPSLGKNLATSSLKIEKEGRKFRFLYAGGSMPNPAFKEVITHEFDMHPKYIGIFAMKGFVDSSANMPVRFTFFRLKENDCSQPGGN